MTEINHINDKELTYYLPQNPVIKPASRTTKLRVGRSLNDVQHGGPTIQNYIFTILLYFSAIVIIADIAWSCFLKIIGPCSALCRVTAYCLRFFGNASVSKGNRVRGV